MTDFNPNSQDAMLARIIANQEEHGRMLKEVRDQAVKTNGRVTALEQEKWFVRGVTASIGLISGAAWEAVKHRFSGQ